MGNAMGSGDDEDWADERGYMPNVGDELDVRIDGRWVRARIIGVPSETRVQLGLALRGKLVKVSRDLVADLEDLDPPGRHTPGQQAPVLVKRDQADGQGGRGSRASDAGSGHAISQSSSGRSSAGSTGSGGSTGTRKKKGFLSRMSLGFNKKKKKDGDAEGGEASTETDGGSTGADRVGSHRGGGGDGPRRGGGGGGGDESDGEADAIRMVAEAEAAAARNGVPADAGEAAAIAAVAAAEAAEAAEAARTSAGGGGGGSALGGAHGGYGGYSAPIPATVGGTPVYDGTDEPLQLFVDGRLYNVTDSIDVKDIFPHKRSKEMMYHWREATVVAVRPPSSVKVHFDGWPAKYDTWIDAQREPSRLAPHRTHSGPGAKSYRLTDPWYAARNAAATSASAGAPSPVSVTRQSGGHYSTGDFVDVNVGEHWFPAQVLHVARSPAGKVTDVEVQYQENSVTEWISLRTGRIAPFGTETTKKHHNYTVGMYVDVKDFFNHRVTGERTYKWRGCEVLEVSGRNIYVHYEGWSHRFDEWIDVVKEPDRVRALGSMTVGETEAEREVKDQESAFRVAMSSAGLPLTDMDADGNCLFRSVAHQIYGDPGRYDSVRQAVCDYMESNRSMFEHAVAGDFDVYLSRMRLDKEWGGHPEQLAIEELYDRPMEIYSRETWAKSNSLAPLKLHFDGELPIEELGDVTPLRLSYHGGSHFNSVSGPGEQPPLGTRASCVIRDARERIMKEAGARALTERSRTASFAITDERKEQPPGDDGERAGAGGHADDHGDSKEAGIAEEDDGAEGTTSPTVHTFSGDDVPVVPAETPHGEGRGVDTVPVATVQSIEGSGVSPPPYEEVIGVDEDCGGGATADAGFPVDFSAATADAPRAPEAYTT